MTDRGVKQAFNRRALRVALDSCATPWQNRIQVMAEPILVARSKEAIFLLPKMANRHGLIAGATGTGKTGHAANARGEF